MEIIYSYPSPPNGCHQLQMMMMMMISVGIFISLFQAAFTETVLAGVQRCLQLSAIRQLPTVAIHAVWRIMPVQVL